MKKFNIVGTSKTIIEIPQIKAENKEEAMQKAEEMLIDGDERIEGSSKDNNIDWEVEEIITCPTCGKKFKEGSGALSRKNEDIEICSDCGKKEALSELNFK